MCVRVCCACVLCVCVCVCRFTNSIHHIAVVIQHEMSNPEDFQGRPGISGEQSVAGTNCNRVYVRLLQDSVEARPLDSFFLYTYSSELEARVSYQEHQDTHHIRRGRGIYCILIYKLHVLTSTRTTIKHTSCTKVRLSLRQARVGRHAANPRWQKSGLRLAFLFTGCFYLTR